MPSKPMPDARMPAPGSLGELAAEIERRAVLLFIAADEKQNAGFPTALADVAKWAVEITESRFRAMGLAEAARMVRELELRSRAAANGGG